MSHPILKVFGSLEPSDPVIRAIEAGLATEKISLEPRETGRDAMLARLGDRNQEFAGQEFSTILDAFRHDREIHRALIARERLPAGIVERLVRLVGNDADLDDLVRRHAVAGSLAENRRSARSRPDWWRSGLVGGRRGS